MNTRTHRFLRVTGTLSWLALVAASLLAASPASASESRTLVVGVDNISPANENFAFLDYYPRAGVRVHNGDIVGFHFTPAASSDEIHTATLGTPGESPFSIFTSPNFPQFVNDGDDPAPARQPFQAQFSNSVLFASNPPVGAPGGCGTAAQPCSYDGSSEINSGIICVNGCPNSEYFYRINVANVPNSGVTVHYVCLIHGPTMQGTLQIVPDDQKASTQRQLNRAASKQYAPQIDAGFEAKENALRQADKTGTVIAGAEDPSGNVQVLEMLPRNLEVGSGSSVNWHSPSLNEIHTVTFPAGHGSDAVDPLIAVCETPLPPDNPISFPGGVPCGNPGLFEDHVNAQPQGVTTIATASDVGTSGVIASIPGFPFASSYTFSFSSPGIFSYQCRIHDHMRGTVTVEGNGGE
jgi:plastocyanin